MLAQLLDVRDNVMEGREVGHFLLCVWVAFQVQVWFCRHC